MGKGAKINTLSKINTLIGRGSLKILWGAKITFEYYSIKENSSLGGTALFPHNLGLSLSVNKL